MPYRRTENVARKLAARHGTILAAARALAGAGGMATVQIAPVAGRAGIAAGTVYRYFPSKTELVAALVADLTQREVAALARAATAAPGPLSALAAAIANFCARALAQRRLAFAMIAEPVEPHADTARLTCRRAIAGEFEARISAAIASGHLPEQDAALAARALLGAMVEGLVGPLATSATQDDTLDDAERRTQVQALTLLVLRALGVGDARARGLVVQAKVMDAEDVA